MKEDFLTIPDLPDYEINSALQVRNKKTRRIMKPRCDSRCKSKYLFVAMKVEGRWTAREVKALRIKALEAHYGSKFMPIPSFQGKYEITKQGQVRNAKTKRILKVKQGTGKNISFYIGGVSITRSITSLLWETFGIINRKKSRMRVPIIITKGNQRLYFDSEMDVARYLAPKVFLSIPGIYRYFRLRKAEIYGWQINYQTF